MAVNRSRLNHRNLRRLKGAPPFLLRRYVRPTKPQPRRKLPLILKLAFLLGFLGFMLFSSGVATAAGVYFYFASQLEGELDLLETRQLFETTRIYDRYGYLLYEVFEEGRRTQIDSIDQVPQHLIDATIAIEDKTFYENPGIDLAGIFRAALENLLRFLQQGGEFEIAGGGSTLTQQFIRNALFDYEYRISPSMERKIKEAILALEMTRTFTKDEIMLMYLNEIAYGNLSYGIEAAAQGYFGKHVEELDLAESAFLAGLPQSPTKYNPFFEGGGGLEQAKARQWDVLRRMAEDGYITQDQADAAYNQELVFASPEIPIEAPHFVMYVRELLEKDPDIGPEKLYGGGLSVYTTLDMRYHRLAEAIIRERMSQEDVIQYNVNNAAMVVMRPDTGEILTMIGSLDYNLVRPSLCGEEDNVIDGKVNAALAERQPGSSFKPFTYLTAFTKGWSPATMVLDVKTKYPVPGHPDYAPENYNRKNYGPIRLRNALGGSLNIPAVKVIQFAGVGETIAMAHRLGITTLNAGEGHYGLSLTLGGGEVRLLDMVNAFSSFANEGRFVPPVAILKIVDAEGNIIREYKPTPLEEIPEVVDPRYAYLVTDILSDDTARHMIFGAHSILELSRPAAVKTGTSEDWGDNWTVGFTPYLAVGVWVGNNNNEPMTLNCIPRERAQGGIPGARSAGHIWHNFMEVIFHPDSEWLGLSRFFPDEEERVALFGDGDLEDILRDEDGDLRYDFRRPAGLVDEPVCAISGKQPTAYCPVVEETFVRGNEPREPCDVHKAVVVIQVPGTDPPVYCLPLEGVAYPPELVQQRVFMDLHSVAKPEEIPGLESWLQGSGTPTIPTWYCPPELGTPEPGQPGQPVQPPQNRWGGLIRSITYPRPYAGVTGPIEIRGSADLTSPNPKDQFAYYKVEWGHKGALSGWPTEWYLIGEGYSPVRNGVLAVWDPGMLTDGSYALRLTVVTQDGQPRYPGDQPGHSYVPVYLDRGPIYVRLLSPQPGSNLPYSEVSLVAKLEGVSPARRVDFFYDGIFIGSAITDTVYALAERIYTVTWPVRPGQHRLTVQATNMAGRQATSQPVLVVGQPPEGILPEDGGAVVSLLALRPGAIPPPEPSRQIPPGYSSIQ